MAAVILSETSFELKQIFDEVNVKEISAVNWNGKNCLSFCAADSIVTFHLVANKKPIAKEIFRISGEHKTRPLSDGKVHCVGAEVLSLKRTMTQLSEKEKLELMFDSAQYEDYYFPNKEKQLLRCAALSPCQTCLVALTFDHRVMFFTQDQQEWKEVLELLPILKAHFLSQLEVPITLGKGLSYTDYKQLIFGMCTNAVVWSTALTDTDLNVHLLFTGMRGGQVLVWRVHSSLSPDNLKQMTLATSDLYKAPVSSLAWHSEGQDKGLLAVGYTDGAVRILQVCIMAGEITVTEIFCDDWADEIHVSILAWSHLSESSEPFLVVSKQYHLVLYTLDSGQWRRGSVVWVEVEQPITSVSVCGQNGVVASTTNDLFSFAVQHLPDGLTLTLTPLRSVTLTSDWICMGCAMSPRGIFLLSAHRYFKCLDRAETRTRNPKLVLTPLQDISLSSLLEILAKPDMTFGDLQELYLYQRMVLAQVLDTEKQNWVKVVEQIEEVLKDKTDQRSLHLLRDLYVYVSCNHFRLDNPLHEDELDLEQKCNTLSNRLIDQHTQTWLKETSTLTLTPAGQCVRAAMQAWSTSKDKTGQDDQWPQCPVCLNNLTKFELLFGECQQGCVKTALCCVSLLPCSGKCHRSCLSCQHPAASLTDLDGVPALDKMTCVLCGGLVGDV